VRVLDLFCGAGGAAMGLRQAWPDAEIVGVDIRPQPHYPFGFVLANALSYPLAGFDFVWASPPCQHYIRSGNVQHARHQDLVGPTRAHLQAWGGPWIMENVPGSPLAAGMLLCGSMFGLRIRRHRLFEANWPLPMSPAACQHHGRITGVYGNPHGEGGAYTKGNKGMLPGDLATWSQEMGIDWMTAPELSQAIPPAYSRYIAECAPVRLNCGYV